MGFFRIQPHKPSSRSGGLHLRPGAAHVVQLVQDPIPTPCFWLLATQDRTWDWCWSALQALSLGTAEAEIPRPVPVTSWSAATPRPTPCPQDARRLLLSLCCSSSSSAAAIPIPCLSLSPPCRAPGRQKERCRVSGETWLSCPAASVLVWTVSAFGRSSAFALVGLWLHSTGCFRRDLWLCKNRQSAILGCGAVLRQPSRPGFLPAVSGSKQCLAFPSRYIWYLCCCYGIEILLLWKSHACRFNRRCQFADGRQSWSSNVDGIQ
uniref:uncharacterized protein LOC100387087 isoform X2 n=1 Tax=Callithrix jacchus TaxID=9483 RepID=UPI00159E36C5|nr:uncharacterized protein LOC100387087 isoform X2 [Callithrix jacchus]